MSTHMYINEITIRVQRNHFSTPSQHILIFKTIL